MNKNVIKFMHRTASNTSDKRIARTYDNGNFDVDLVTSDEKKVSAHRFVLALYSKYLATQINDASFNGMLVIPLNNLPFEIVQKVVHLMYFREVTLPEDLISKMNDALKFLKIDDTNVTKVDTKDKEVFKMPDVPVAVAQRKIVPTPKPAAGVPIQQRQQLPQQQQQQQKLLQQQQQSKVVRAENTAKDDQVESYVPGKRKRAQSTFVSGSARDPDLFTASHTPMVNGGGNKNVSALNLAQMYPHLNISKVPRLQPQPPKVVSSQPADTSLTPLVKQMNVDSIMELPIDIASQSTGANPSLVKKPNVGATMQTPEKTTTTSNIQPQQQARPTQSPTIPNLSPSITIQKVIPTAEKAHSIQNDDMSKQPDDNEALSNEMETDNGSQYDDDIVMDSEEEEESTEEKKCDDNNNFDAKDLRDLLPSLRDTETQ